MCIETHHSCAVQAIRINELHMLNKIQIGDWHRGVLHSQRFSKSHISKVDHNSKAHHKSRADHVHMQSRNF